jgi:hypothetical protein
MMVLCLLDMIIQLIVVVQRIMILKKLSKSSVKIISKILVRQPESDVIDSEN